MSFFFIYTCWTGGRINHHHGVTYKDQIMGLTGELEQKKLQRTYTSNKLEEQVSNLDYGIEIAQTGI